VKESPRTSTSSKKRSDHLQNLKDETKLTRGQVDSLDRERRRFKRTMALLQPSLRDLLLILITFVLAFSLSQSIDSNRDSNETEFVAGKSLLEVTSGQVALTAEELREAIRLLGITAYWVGPEDGYLYSLESRVNGQVFIKYLPNGDGIDDTRATYRVIATYALEEAFDATRAAGSIEGGVGLLNPDGAAIYYNRSEPSNVYLAYEGENFQIEIFDPGIGVSINLATEPTRVKKI
jgi:hypothetical protein